MSLYCTAHSRLPFSSVFLRKTKNGRCTRSGSSYRDNKSLQSGQCYYHFPAWVEASKPYTRIEFEWTSCEDRCIVLSNIKMHLQRKCDLQTRNYFLQANTPFCNITPTGYSFIFLMTWWWNMHNKDIFQK